MKEIVVKEDVERMNFEAWCKVRNHEDRLISHSTDTFSASAISKRYFGCRTCPSRIFAIAGRDTPTAIAKELAFIPLVSITVLILLPKVSMFTPRK